MLAVGLPEPTVPGRILSTGPSCRMAQDQRRLPPCLFVLAPSPISGRAPFHLQDMIVREARALLDQGSRN